LAKDTFDGLITASDDEKDLVLQSVISNSAIIYMLSLESMENIPNSLRKEDISSEIINRIERTNERIFLQDSIEKLTLEEKILVKMYYYEGKSQVDISIALNVSKSKVCRMHVLTLTKLKKKLAQKIKSEWSV
ncbi:MAG: sigma factor-like helix-turn-helix DNA-binding protein, partial [Candidatus Margulisiibacteriota bacterium]